MLEMRPVLLCGKSPPHIRYMQEHLQPEYNCECLIMRTLYQSSMLTTVVVHVCFDMVAVQTELLPLLRGEPVLPSSGFGSNATSSQVVSGLEIRGIIIGGLFQGEELSKIRELVVQGGRPMAIFWQDLSNEFVTPLPEQMLAELKPLMNAKRNDDGFEEGFYFFGNGEWTAT